MAVTYINSLRSTRMQLVIGALDANIAPAVLEIGTGSMALVLASIVLSKASFSEAGGTITMIGTPKTATAAASGAAAAARLKDGGGNIVISGLTVSTSGADVVLNATAISVGQSVTINSATIQHG
jgi:hypothetical protein